jgi:hypothetical protein
MKRTLRIFVLLMVVGLVVCVPAFLLMQALFGLAETGSAIFEVAGFALFAVWIASIAAAAIGVVGTIVQLVRQSKQ